MLGTIKSILLGLVAGALFGVVGNAAPVTYRAGNVSAALVGTCDGFCNVALTGFAQTPILRTVDDGDPNTLDAILFVPLPPQDSEGDSFTVLASIALRIQGTIYTYLAEGLVTGWRIGPLGVFQGGSLSWISQPTIPPGSPLAVVFNDRLLTGLFGVRYSTLTISTAASVVPLPGGVLLLLTALAGLFGLSRRRRVAV